MLCYFILFYANGRTDLKTESHINKSAQSNLRRGPHRSGLSGPWAVHHCAVACIHEYAS